jgi:hypothetical protein
MSSCDDSIDCPCRATGSRRHRREEERGERREERVERRAKAKEGRDRMASVGRGARAVGEHGH